MTDASHEHDHAQDDDAKNDSETTDPEVSRKAAHVILDGLTASDPDQPNSDQNREAMELAFSRLLEIEAIELLYDEEEEELELDVSPLMEGVLLVVRRLVADLAARTGQSPDDIVASVRSGIDAG